MNVEEKVNELLEKFKSEAQIADKYNYNLESENVSVATRCALIHINEMIEKLAEFVVLDYDSTGMIRAEMRFYESVRTSLQNR